MMHLSFPRDSVAVVTGGARGIGQAVVGSLASQGIGIAALDLPIADFSDVESVCRSADVPFEAIAVDVRDRDAVFGALADASSLGAVRFAVNCAGVDSPGDSDQVTTAAWERVIDIDLNGVFYSCQAEYEQIRHHGGGAIVNIASISGHIINRGCDAHVGYSAAKAGVIQVSRGLGVEWAGQGVRVNSVSPGYTWTEMNIHNSPERNRMFAEHTPIARLATPDEIAAPVTFLLSDGASYITATDLAVDGGFLAW